MQMNSNQDSRVCLKFADIFLGYANKILPIKKYPKTILGAQGKIRDGRIKILPYLLYTSNSFWVPGTPKTGCKMLFQHFCAKSERFFLGTFQGLIYLSFS